MQPRHNGGPAATDWDRADWVSYADRLLAGARAYASPDHARITLPGAEGGYGRAVDGLEGFARTFILAAFRLAGEQGRGLEELADFYARGVAAGVDARCANRWVRMDEHAQAKVVAASIALGLDMTRPWIWDQLAPARQDALIEYLAAVVGDALDWGSRQPSVYDADFASEPLRLGHALLGSACAEGGRLPAQDEQALVRGTVALGLKGVFGGPHLDAERVFCDARRRERLGMLARGDLGGGGSVLNHALYAGPSAAGLLRVLARAAASPPTAKVLTPPTAIAAAPAPVRRRSTPPAIPPFPPAGWR